MLSEQLREDLEVIVSGDFISEFDIDPDIVKAGIKGIAGLTAMGIVLGPWFARQRKIKKQRKEKCNKFEGLQRKRCMIQIEIDALKKEKAQLLASATQCNRHPEPKKSKCKDRIKTMARDYDIRIQKEQSKMG